MKRTEISSLPFEIPEKITDIISGARIFDSSSSPEARVYFIDKDEGYYLKISEGGSLGKEALLTEYFRKKGLSAKVLHYSTLGGKDILLTSRVKGEDLTTEKYLSEPKRLARRLGEELRALHETSFDGCPITDRNKDYLALADKNYRSGIFDNSLDLQPFVYKSADEAYKALTEIRSELKTEVLLHGDYCLPNVMFDGWRFSGFIDLGNGGVGDRHIDIFWGAWTLKFNLGTDAYRDDFLDAYGRDGIDNKMLRGIAAAECFG